MKCFVMTLSIVSCFKLSIFFDLRSLLHTLGTRATKSCFAFTTFLMWSRKKGLVKTHVHSLFKDQGRFQLATFKTDYRILVWPVPFDTHHKAFQWKSQAYCRKWNRAKIRMCGITSWSLNESRKEVAGSFLQCEYLLAFVFFLSCSLHNECDPPSWKTILEPRIKYDAAKVSGRKEEKTAQKCREAQAAGLINNT